MARCGSSTPAAEATDERFPSSSMLRGPSIQTESSCPQCTCSALHGRSGPRPCKPGKRWHLVPLQHQVCPCPLSATMFALKSHCPLEQNVLRFVKVFENEEGSGPPDESPLLLSAPARVSYERVDAVSAPCHRAAF